MRKCCKDTNYKHLTIGFFVCKELNSFDKAISLSRFQDESVYWARLSHNNSN